MHASWKTAQTPAVLLVLAFAAVGCAGAGDVEDPGISPADEVTSAVAEADQAAPGSGVSVTINQNGWDDHDTSSNGGQSHHHGGHGCKGHHGHKGHWGGSQQPPAPPADQDPPVATPPAPPPPAPPANQAPLPT